MQKAAVIGIGSNSVRMLIAEVEEGGFRRLAREREGTRLFAGLDAEGNLCPESMEKTATAVEQMTGTAEKNGCGRVHIFATSASRDAKNGERFLQLLREKTGREPEIISGEEEAALSFLGATDLAPEGERCGIIDIGGGSTEIVIGSGLNMEMVLSCQMGAVRLYRMMPIEKKEDMAGVEDMARRILEEKWKSVQAPPVPDIWIGTGGTFTALAALARGVHWTDRTCMHGTCLEMEKIREIGQRLAGMTIGERLQLEGLQPSRADIVVHGICILIAVMEHVGTKKVQVSEYGNLDGYLKKHYGGKS